MVKTGSHARRARAFFFAAYLALVAPANAADLRPQAAQAYDRYIELTAAQVTVELAPSGIIHHWIGRMFVPGATLGQTISFMEDYDHKTEYFKPDIVRSKILRHEGDDYFVQLRFYKKKIITTVIDTDQEIHYHVVDSTHAYSRSRTTRVQEVENAGTSDEKLEAEGHDRGFMWRMNTYWRFEEKDGGTYVECQAISLTRDIPAGLGWMVGS